MIHHPLTGVIEKLRRSDVHLVSLYNETVRYLNSSPYGFSMQRDTGDGKPGIKFHITKQPPIYLSTIIGDAIHNLRASLDYIAHELTVANDATPTRQTQFPVGLTEDDFLNQAIKLRKLDTVSLRAFKVVSAFQPYRLDAQKRTAHVLWQLVKLSNLDKHHTLALSAIAPSTKTTFIHPDGRQLVCEFKDSFAHDDTVVAAMSVDFFNESIKTHFEASCRIGFVDEPLTDHEPVGVIHNIREFIGKLILPAIEPFFDPLPDHLRLISHGLPPEVLASAGRPLQPEGLDSPSTEKG